MSESKRNRANFKTLGEFSLIAVAMFGFGFALAPLYEAFCQAFGINGRFVEIQDGTYDVSKKVANMTAIDETRQIKVQFTASRNQNMNWEFKAMEREVSVNPGEIRVVKFYAKNNTDRTVVAQAVPSVSPGKATKYFNKMECFCFTQQTFKPGEAREMPLRFVVDPALPGKISTLTLAYTFFDTENRKAANENAKVTKLAVHSGSPNTHQ